MALNRSFTCPRTQRYEFRLALTASAIWPYQRWCFSVCSGVCKSSWNMLPPSSIPPDLERTLRQAKRSDEAFGDSFAEFLHVDFSNDG